MSTLFRCTLYALHVATDRLGQSPVLIVDTLHPREAALAAMKGLRREGYPQVPETERACMLVEQDARRWMYVVSRVSAPSWSLQEIDLPEGDILDVVRAQAKVYVPPQPDAKAVLAAQRRVISTMYDVEKARCKDAVDCGATAQVRESQLALSIFDRIERVSAETVAQDSAERLQLAHECYEAKAELAALKAAVLTFLKARHTPDAETPAEQWCAAIDAAEEAEEKLLALLSPGGAQGRR